MLTILKISGAVSMAAGLALIASALIAAKRSGTFEAIKELRRIRTSGYITEHKIYTGEDVYRNELSSSQARLMSRRAKRVLEKLDQEDSPEKKQINAAGTSMLEEVEPRRAGEERAAALPQKAMRAEGTAILPETSEGTDILILSGGTDILTETEERTGLLDKADTGTAVLDEKVEAANSGERTAVLEQENRGPGSGEGTAILQEPEGTAILRDQGEATGILDNGEGTDILEEEY